MKGKWQQLLSIIMQGFLIDNKETMNGANEEPLKLFTYQFEFLFE